MKQESTDTTPLVSVIVPAYNAAAFIGETLDYLCWQTYRNLEIIIIDDGSTDTTKDVVSSRIDKRISYYYQPNQGPSESRNAGLARAKGKFVIWVDNDDLLLPNAIVRAVGFLEEHPEYAAVYYDFFYFKDGSPRRYFRHQFARHWQGDILKHLLVEGPCGNPSQVLLRREAIQDARYDKNLAMSEEWDFYIQLAARGCLFGHIPEVLVYRRIRVSSMTATVVARLATKESTFKLYTKWKNKVSEKGISIAGAYGNTFFKKMLLLCAKEEGRAHVLFQITKGLEEINIPVIRRRLRVLRWCVRIFPMALIRVVILAIDRLRTRIYMKSTSAPPN